jgi:DNA-damage-inducible protein J
MAMTTININTDIELKEKAQAIFSELGFDISTAVNIFLKQAVAQEGLPFEVKIKRKDSDSRYLLEPDPSKTPVFGCMKGKMKIMPDFDEPLEEMKEYMY